MLNDITRVFETIDTVVIAATALVEVFRRNRDGDD